MSEELVQPAFEAPGEYVPPVDTAPKRGRGRPPKSSEEIETKGKPAAKKNAVKVKLSKEEQKEAHDKSAASIAQLLQVATGLGAKITGTPEIALDGVEAGALARAFVDCLEAWFPESHGAILSPKITTTVALVGTGGLVVAKKKGEIRARKAKLVNPPAQAPAPTPPTEKAPE